MRLTGSYQQILRLSIPIMIGSAAQQVITLSDSVFLFPLGEADFAAIGFVGVFYLVVAAIGYGFSKGGQIMIARHAGAEDAKSIGLNFHAMLLFELLLATLLFGFMQWVCPFMFDMALESEVVYGKSLEYLHYRSPGVFFSYVGLSFIAMYTGVARTTFILVDTIVLGVLNVILNYGLIYGEWGLPEMGIAGAGLASTIAEIVAFLLFILYMLFDKKSYAYGIFSLPKWNGKLVGQQIKIALPVVAQSVLGLGSWVVFFAVIDNLGEEELAKANLIRMLYLVLSIPTWGFCSGINTMVSNCIGQAREDLIMPVTRRTAGMTLSITLAMMAPILAAPEYFLTFIFKFGEGGAMSLDLITDSMPILYVLVGVLVMFTISGVYFNALSGTGATLSGLKIQLGCVLLYLVAIYATVNFLGLGQPWAWGMEMLYWGTMFGVTYWYLQSGRWRKSMF